MPARRAAGVKEELILYYMSSDYSKSWPYIPPNLTHFALDDYRKCSRFLVGVLDFRKKLLRRSGLDVSVVPRPLLEPMRHGAVPVQRRRLPPPARLPERDLWPLGVPAV